MTDWQKRTAGIEVGDKVQYSRDWLRSTGTYTGDLPFAKGKVIELKPLGDTMLAVIDWGNPDIPSKVNIKNLHKVGTPEVER